MEIVLDHVLAEHTAGPVALRESMNRLMERAGHVRQILRRVHVAFECRRRLDAMLDSVESRGDRRGEREIRIRIRAGRAAFDAQRLSVSNDPKSGGAVVDAPRHASRGERSGYVSLVGRGIRCVKRKQLADVLHPAAEEVAERSGGMYDAMHVPADYHRLPV